MVVAGDLGAARGRQDPEAAAEHASRMEGGFEAGDNGDVVGFTEGGGERVEGHVAVDDEHAVEVLDRFHVFGGVGGEVAEDGIGGGEGVGGGVYGRGGVGGAGVAGQFDVGGESWADEVEGGVGDVAVGGRVDEEELEASELLRGGDGTREGGAGVVRDLGEGRWELAWVGAGGDTAGSSAGAGAGAGWAGVEGLVYKGW